jgi:hypothetical protein
MKMHVKIISLLCRQSLFSNFRVRLVVIHQLDLNAGYNVFFFFFFVLSLLQNLMEKFVMWNLLLSFSLIKLARKRTSKMV